jgi:hypothetical protein
VIIAVRILARTPAILMFFAVVLSPSIQASRGLFQFGQDHFIPSSSCFTRHPNVTACNTDSQVARTTKFCTVAPNICGSSVWNFLHVTILVPRILRWLLNFFGNLCSPADSIVTINRKHLQTLKEKSCKSVVRNPPRIFTCKQCYLHNY